MRHVAFFIPTALAFLGATLGLTTWAAEAHPGALDSNGCHHVRRTGRTICHAGHTKPGEHRRYVGFDGVVRHYSH